MNSSSQKTLSRTSILGGMFVLIVLALLQILIGRVDFETYNHLPGPFIWNLGPLNDVIVACIGLVQVFIVAFCFMGLKLQKPLHILSFLLGGFFVLAFLIVTLTDTQFRDIVDPVEGEKVQTVKKK
ncbi:MAG: hypothetical protein HQK83_07345 [Fibrobacteria bacterium]|nr:hypothetical protein [Fibrobacteria bacterium]